VGKCNSVIQICQTVVAMVTNIFTKFYVCHKGRATSHILVIVTSITEVFCSVVADLFACSCRISICQSQL